MWRSTAILVIGIGVSVLTTTEGFSSPANHRQHHPGQHHAISRLHHFARRELVRPGYGWGRSAGYGWVFYGPGYTFVPGKGILDEACNLPTSACPNTERDGG